MSLSQEITTKKGVQKLPCQLTEDEQRLRGIDLAEKNTEFADTKEEAAGVAKRYRETLKAINDVIHDLKDAVRSGVEMRPVEVEYRINNYLGNVTIVRVDTGEELLRRRLTPDELQGKFDFDAEIDLTTDPKNEGGGASGWEKENLQ